MLDFIIICCALFMITNGHASTNLKLFPIDNYSQNVDEWIDPFDNDSLLDYDYQQQRFNELKHSYFGTNENDMSPWSGKYIRSMLLEQSESLSISNHIMMDLDFFDNTEQEDKRVIYGENFHPYTSDWIDGISSNIDLDKFRDLQYFAKSRAITTENLLMRAIPTNDPAYYSSDIAGQGYPFDVLELSDIHAGTPLYVFGTTIDKQWSLVITPDSIVGWVKSGGVAYVNSSFIKRWQKSAYANLAGIVKSGVVTNQYNQYQFNTYTGMLFPVVKQSSNTIDVLIPFRKPNGMATISHSTLKNSEAMMLPLDATPANFSKVLKALLGKPYGWGDAYFYTDCSSEMKSIFTLFGFFMPRNSVQQLSVGRVVDISSFNKEQRLSYLVNNGIPLLTMIYTRGHIMLYVGAYKKYDKGSEFALVYQQMWGLSSKDRSSRSVVGKSLFFPLLFSYPEDETLMGQLEASSFQLVYLDQMPQAKLNGLSKLLSE